MGYVLLRVVNLIPIVKQAHHVAAPGDIARQDTDPHHINATCRKTRYLPSSEIKAIVPYQSCSLQTVHLVRETRMVYRQLAIHPMTK